MKKLTITKEFEWDCAHCLSDEKYTHDKNLEVFGKCNSIHGHTYKLFVTVSTKGNQLNDGMVINFVELKEIVNKLVVERFDHKLLNEDELYKNRLTTCENQVYDIWDILEPELDRIGIDIEEIKLYETPTSCATLTK